MDKTEIRFLKQKEYKVVKELSRGGFGETILLVDETINESFVCKKYSPYYESDREYYYTNFVQEIKLLYVINHKNIVRVFNYYLYTEQYTGYILMEYVNGATIKEFLKVNADSINDIFLQAINGFEYLEQLKILHRDIRPENILITKNGTLKIIDFGFGKKIDFQSDGFGKSISLNWRYTTPSEFKDQIYDFQTEIYFVGKLFEEIINENQIDTFHHMVILNKMIVDKREDRITSFFDIGREISKETFSKLTFTTEQKRVYKRFAESLVEVVHKIYSGCQYRNDLDEILQRLETSYENSILEDNVQNVPFLATTFLKGKYKFFTKKDFPVEFLKDFLNFFKVMSKQNQRVILNNLWQRFDRIERITIGDDSLPF